MANNTESLPPLEQGLLDALQSLDTQIAREMQRTPSERATHGVQKWEPYQKRIERICVFLLEAFGEKEAELDSVLVLAQAFSKSLRMIVEDLGEDGLGKVRSGYCLSTFESIAKDAELGADLLRHKQELV